MRVIKTYEGFFDFFKKKNYDPVSIRHILDCLLPITDCDDIKSWLKGDRIDGMFVYDLHYGFLDDTLRISKSDKTGGLEIRQCFILLDAILTKGMG